MEFKGTKGKLIIEPQREAFFETYLVTKEKGEFVADFANEYDVLIFSKAPEMLGILNRIHGEMMRNDGVFDVEKWGNQIESLIKSATEL